MASLDHLAHLRRELDSFAACLGGDLAAPVEYCGDWTLYDLADHLGDGNLWAATAITEKHGDRQNEPAPSDHDGLATWFAHTAAVLLDAASADPDTAAWTFYPPHTVGFWRRRRAQETLIHRWDAEHALGLPSTFDPDLAGDGIAEVIDTTMHRMIARGRARPPEQAVRFVASGTGSSWILGPGRPVATVTGTAQDLLLMLWNRKSADDPAIGWDGDRAAAAAVLAGPLVP